jgi:hypothetical protein
MIFRSGLNSLAVTLVISVVATSSGCSDPLPSAGGTAREAPAARSSKDRYEVTAADRASYGVLLKAHAQGEQRALRIQVDAARNRLWVLGLQHVYVYDITAKLLVRRVALPDRSVAGFVCPPDMALDPSGAAFIASNVASTLWKIDAEDFGIQAQEITLHQGANRDIGFGALTFAADGTLYALTAHEGSLWRIDVATLRAHEVALSQRLLNTCALRAADPRIASGPPPSVVLCAAAGHSDQNPRAIVISPDFTRGQISNEKCSS